MSAVTIAGKTIDRDGPPLIIAEIGVNHDGDLSVAHALIHQAKSAGADAVKFQLFEAKLLLANEAGLVTYQKSSADSAGDLLEPLQLSANQMAELVRAAHHVGLLAITTPFSPSLAAPAARIGNDALKLASPDLVNRPLVAAAIATGLRLILSTGAATMDEIAQALSWLGPAAARTIFLHCVSSYPTPADHATLGAITAMRNRWPQISVGYSDHTTLTHTGALAVAAGACVLEKHLTLDKSRKGPDHAASLTPEEFGQYVTLAREAFAMRGPIAKQPNPIELEVRLQARQSVVVLNALSAGTTLTANDLTVKRPGTGIPAADFEAILGRTLARSVAANTVLLWDDLVPLIGRGLK